MRLIFILICTGLILTAPASADFTPIWRCSGSTDSSNYGWYIVAAGDQNMDGFDDILVANWRAGEVFLYFGGNPMDTIPDMVFTEPHTRSFGALPQQCRDLNGDGHPDISISADWDDYYARSKVYIYFGGPMLDNQADLLLVCDELDTLGEQFGEYCSMGDFNGDGYADLGVSAKHHLVYSLGIDGGKILVFFGGSNMDSVPDFTISGQAHGWFTTGEMLSISGDVNNDGFDDMLVRSGSTSLDRSLFLGGAQPDSTIDWIYTSTYIGGGNCIIPDINRDGFDEIIFGFDLGNWCSAAFFWGGENISDNPDAIPSGRSSSLNWCAYAGDVNADGYSDVLLGSIPSGAVYLCLLHPNISGFYYSDHTFQYPGFGRNMGYAGDINRDGIDDFFLNSGTNPYFPFRGQVFIYSDTTLTPGVKRDETELSAAKFRILGNYPNPFNNSSVVLFSLDKPQWIDLNIYNLLGRRVVRLANGQYERGFHRTVWNGNDVFGNPVASGIYIIELMGSRNRSIRKIEIVK